MPSFPCAVCVYIPRVIDSRESALHSSKVPQSRERESGGYIYVLSIPSSSIKEGERDTQWRDAIRRVSPVNTVGRAKATNVWIIDVSRQNIEDRHYIYKYIPHAVNFFFEETPVVVGGLYPICICLCNIKCKKKKRAHHSLMWRKECLVKWQPSWWRLGARAKQMYSGHFWGFAYQDQWEMASIFA